MPIPERPERPERGADTQTDPRAHRVDSDPSDLAGLCYSDIGDISRRFRDRSLSPVELTEALLERIARLNPSLNVYLAVSADLARQQASTAEQRFAAGADLGPLAGVPIGLKDLYDVAGQPTTAGSPIPGRLPGGGVAAEDSFVSAKLRAAGAVFLGKHNLHEWALGVTTNNPHFGPCRNPWDPSRIPGGSSGGSGAALAAGLAFGAFGSDTGGSIRIPASLCGCVGLKPTTGRVSLRGVTTLSWSLDHAGPLARTVADAALLLSAVDGYDPLDPTCLAGARPDPRAEIELGACGLRVLVPENHFFTSSDAEVVRLVEAAIGVLASEGARLERVWLPGIENLSTLNATIIVADAVAYHAADLAERADLFGEDVLARMRQGESGGAREYALARRAGIEWRRKLELLLEGPTVLVLPTTPTAAPEIAGLTPLVAARRLTAFTGLFDLTGLPALSVPCGFTGAGLPVGLQIVGQPWAEATILRAGAAYQRATSWHHRRPGSFAGEPAGREPGERLLPPTG